MWGLGDGLLLWMWGLIVCGGFGGCVEVMSVVVRRIVVSLFGVVCYTVVVLFEGKENEMIVTAVDVYANDVIPVGLVVVGGDCYGLVEA